MNQFICIAGGLASRLPAAVAYGRLSRDACAYCGRSHAAAGWTTPSAAARWGRWAVGIAVYPGYLRCDALGVGAWHCASASARSSCAKVRPSVWLAGAGLATVALGGALLTLGLVQRSARFPRWTRVLAGRRVPPALAIVPAALVAVVVTPAGLMFVRLMYIGTLWEVFRFIDAEDWAAPAPELLWPLWGVALGAATLAYYYRRRGPCAVSGRG